MQDGTAGPSHVIAQPVREEDRPASRTPKLIGQRGRNLAIAAAVLYFALGASALGLHDDIPGEVWSWSRTSLIGLILIGLTLAGWGYGVNATERQAGRVTTAVAAAGAAAVAAVEASRVDMHDDHAALHRENVALRAMIGPLVEAAGRLQAYEERRTAELATIREEVKGMHELLAVMRQESPPAELFVARIGELHQRQDDTENVLAEVAAKVSVAYTTGFTDGIGGPAE